MTTNEIKKHIHDIEARLDELQEARADALDTLQKIEHSITFLRGKHEVFAQLLPNEQAEKPGDGNHDPRD
jgi:chromosome segregation ATPase